MDHFYCLRFLKEIHFGNIFFQLPTLSEPNLMDSLRDNQKKKKEAPVIPSNLGNTVFLQHRKVNLSSALTQGASGTKGLMCVFVESHASNVEHFFNVDELVAHSKRDT